MKQMYHESMTPSYEATGRRHQKARTREALVAAARRILADAGTLSIEQAAREAAISRTTAYRYFPTATSRPRRH
jgi:AcrR family transcriptional regulator